MLAVVYRLYLCDDCIESDAWRQRNRDLDVINEDEAACCFLLK